MGSGWAVASGGGVQRAAGIKACMFSVFLRLIICEKTNSEREKENMHLRSILNRTEKHKGFIYKSEVFISEPNQRPRIEITIEPRKGSKGYCSGCGKRGSTYDTGKPRKFQHVPMWGILVFFVYSMRRIACRKCGVTTELIPWSDGKHQLTTSFRWFLAHWAKKMSWADVSLCFYTSWNSVYRSIEMAVKWGRKRMDLSGISSLGVDEVQWQYGHKYLTLVYQIDKDARRLLWIGQDRTEATFQNFFDWFGEERSLAIKFICSDMWKAYINVIRLNAVNAIHVLDRFHIMTHFSKAIDQIRAEEHRSLKDKGLETLKHSRWCLLKRRENLTDKQCNKLNDLLQYNLRSIRAYLLKEDFQQFWDYISPAWAEKFLDIWCKRTMRSRLEPIKKIVRMLRRYKPEILNYFHARKQVSQGCVEGLNNKVKTVVKKHMVFSEYKTIKMALYHQLGNLPEPEFTHRFW
jgi:transposase